ncbi:MAG TPA: hypothetical protein VKU84_10860, partial [Stellaceae bacterium]|nr:hypothetical protein [Stellaceae bacterium]
GHQFNPSVLTEAADLLRERVSDWFQSARNRLEDIPFDIDDPRQLAIATEVGAAVEWSISTHHPTPYPGRVEVLAIELLAEMVDRPHWPWRKVLTGEWGVGALQCQHHEIFTTHAPEVFAWVKQRLDELPAAPAGAPASESPKARL